MRVIVAGSRSATFEQTLAAVNACHFSDDATCFVSGCAGGADTHGITIANQAKIPVKRYPANWQAFGKSAGIRRNVEMANNAGALIAVWDGSSRGTKHMIDEATKRNLLVFVYTFGGKHGD